MGVIKEYEKRGVTPKAYLKDMLGRIETFKWALYRLDTERPQSYLCHDWNVIKNAFSKRIEDVKSSYASAKKMRNPKYDSSKIKRLDDDIGDCERLFSAASSYLVTNECYQGKSFKVIKSLKKNEKEAK